MPTRPYALYALPTRPWVILFLYVSLVAQCFAKWINSCCYEQVSMHSLRRVGWDQPTPRPTQPTPMVAYAGGLWKLWRSLLIWFSTSRKYNALSNASYIETIWNIVEISWFNWQSQCDNLWYSTRCSDSVNAKWPLAMQGRTASTSFTYVFLLLWHLKTDSFWGSYHSKSAPSPWALAKVPPFFAKEPVTTRTLRGVHCKAKQIQSPDKFKCCRCNMMDVFWIHTNSPSS